MLYTVSTTRSVQEVAQAFPEVAAKYKFGVLGVHNLRQKMNDKGVAFDHDCLVFEICNPQQAKAVLERNLAISTALPCRVSVYAEGGRTVIATLLPSALLAMFPNPDLQPVAAVVEQGIKQVMGDLAAPR